MKRSVLVVDNYDSFTFNLVQALLGLGADVVVRRNDVVELDEVRASSHVVISPGPGRPSDAGRSCQVIETCLGEVALLGVCLGHQCLVEVMGGKVVRNARLMHGKQSRVHHDRLGVLDRMPSPFLAGRYHSLVASDDLPGALKLTAWTSHGEVMGVRATGLGAEGVQFHPESLLTPRGVDLLASFLDQPAPNADLGGA